jgi:hypothetical protein
LAVLGLSVGESHWNVIGCHWHQNPTPSAAGCRANRIFVALRIRTQVGVYDQIRTRVPARELDFEISELSRGARNSK